MTGGGPSFLPGNPILRRAALISMDTVLMAAGLAIIFSVWVPLRSGSFPAEYVSLFAHAVGPVVVLRVALFWWFGLYRAMARRTGTYEIGLIALADTLATAVIVLLNFSTRFIPSLGSWPVAFSGEHLLRLPWGVVLTDWMGVMIAIGGVRLLRRELEIGWLRLRPADQKRVLIVGAGDAGEQVARDLMLSTQGAYRPVAFVDPNPALLGMEIQGVPVVGNLDQLGPTIEKFNADEIVIALQAPAPRVISAIVDQCRSARLAFKIVPPLTSVMSGRIEVSMLRPVEIEDLLGRPPVDLNQGESIGYLAGKRVLVTGAGGSIGSELCRQTIVQRPSSLALLGRGENSLFEALVELRPQAAAAGIRLETFIADVRDAALIGRIFEQFRPEVVFHAAAHKHVHFMQAQPAEAILNNVRGTLVVARAAEAAGAERMISISTDKAVRPNGYMGASKRVAEMLISAFNRRSAASYVSVRFGNVLGSRGSVIPTFRRQIERGGPVTVTHPEVTRYFMTTTEAVSLVIQAGARGKGGELFVLDMGDPVRIADLAHNLITLSGLEPGRDIEIEFTGLRPGEKLTEELMTDAEGLTKTDVGKLFIMRNEERAWEELEPVLDELFAAAEADDRAKIDEILGTLIPDLQIAAAANNSINGE